MRTEVVVSVAANFCSILGMKSSGGITALAPLVEATPQRAG
jgi:hypothetical protein